MSAKSFQLNNGIIMPAQGFGTASISADDEIVTQTVLQALQAGYRHIDTASIYSNEKNIGSAIKQSGIAREDLFLVTKIWTTQQRDSLVVESIDKSMNDLGVDYMDLILIHWPVPGKFIETWRILEETYYKGKCKAIGVGNCNEHHILEIMRECTVKPVLNQYEFHPRFTSLNLRAFCARHSILFEAYYLLGNGMYENNDILLDIGKRYKKTIPQILLRWAFQYGVSTIVKTSCNDRMMQNQDIFDFALTSSDMVQIDALNKEFRLINVDPNNVDF